MRIMTKVAKRVKTIAGAGAAGTGKEEK